MNGDMYYLVEIYLPEHMCDSNYVKELTNQCSTVFGGTTTFDAKGTYLDEKPEHVHIIRVYIPASANQDQLIDIFTVRKQELHKRFPKEQEILITLSEGHRFL